MKNLSVDEVCKRHSSFMEHFSCGVYERRLEQEVSLGK